MNRNCFFILFFLVSSLILPLHAETNNIIISKPTASIKITANVEVSTQNITKAVVYPIKKPDILIRIKGMVCAFCAQGIQKQFDSHPAVKKVVVQLKDITVYIKLKPFRKLQEDDIQRIIQDAGYKVDTITYL